MFRRARTAPSQPTLILVSMTGGDPAEHSDPQFRLDPLPLRGRVAVVTGVSRRAGIGYAIARRLASMGAGLFLHHHVPHDRAQPWGADPAGTQAVMDGVAQALADPQATLAHRGLDLTDPDAPEQLIAVARAELGHLD